MVLEIAILFFGNWKDFFNARSAIFGIGERIFEIAGFSKTQGIPEIARSAIFEIGQHLFEIANYIWKLEGILKKQMQRLQMFGIGERIFEIVIFSKTNREFQKLPGLQNFKLVLICVGFANYC